MDNEMQAGASLENEGAEGSKPFKFTARQKRLLKAYRSTDGNISKASELAGVTRPMFYKEINGCPEFKEALHDIDETDLDMAESQLKFFIEGQYIHKKDKDGNVMLDAKKQPIREYIHEPKEKSTIFFLETKGKKRGYIKRQEVTGADGSAVGGFEINISRKKKGEQ